MAVPSLRIGEVAKRAGVGAKAIRFYEAAGVLPRAARAENGYRLYSAQTIAVLRFVKQAQGLGLTLGEIREVIAIRQRGRPPCAHVRRLLLDKTFELDRKLVDLVAIRRKLRQSLRTWTRRRATRATICPHIEHARRK